MDQLQKENEELKKALQDREMTLHNFLNSFNEITANLGKIKDAEQAIFGQMQGKRKLNEEEREIIKKQVGLINTIMDRNKNIMDSLKTTDYAMQLDTTVYSQVITNLNRQIEENTQKVTLLKTELVKSDFALESMDFALELLSQTNNEQAEIIEQKEKQLNTAYYIQGSLKELMDKGIIVKEKKLTGLGKRETLVKDLDKSLFTRIDIREKTDFSLSAGEVKVFTPHPTHSFKVEGDAGAWTITITDPKEFWSATKFFVIVTE